MIKNDFPKQTWFHKKVSLKVGFNFIGGTDYACNFGCNRDYICLQSWFKRGPNMPAISVFDTDHIFLRSLIF